MTHGHARASVVPAALDESAPAMTTKSCLRCDWQGETTEGACPNCGARPLYAMKALPKREEDVPRATSPLKHPPPTELIPSVKDEPGSTRRSIGSIASFVLAALVVVVGLNAWLGQPRAGDPTTSPVASPTPTRAPATRAFVDPFEAPAFRQYETTVGGVPLSFRAARRWEWHDHLSLNISTVGPQGAEALILWTSFPDGGKAHPSVPAPSWADR
jgi:hypothetical protein